MLWLIYHNVPVQTVATLDPEGGKNHQNLSDTNVQLMHEHHQLALLLIYHVGILGTFHRTKNC
jgi:hypothetical protein